MRKIACMGGIESIPISARILLIFNHFIFDPIQKSV